MASDYSQLYQQAGQQYNVDPRLLAAIVQVESGGNPKAVSDAGAQGLAQLMPATAKALGVTDPFDPQQSVVAAARLLSQNLDRYGGNVQDAVRAYHGGTDSAAWGPKTQQYLASVEKAYAGGSQTAQDAFDRYFGGAPQGAPQAPQNSSAKPGEDAFDKYFSASIPAHPSSIPAQTGTNPAPAPAIPPQTQTAGAQPGGVSWSGWMTPVQQQPWMQTVGMGLLRGAADVGNTVGNVLDPLAQALQNRFGTLGGPSVEAAKAERDAQVAQFNQLYGNSPLAVGARVIGNVVLTAPLLMAGGEALGANPLIAGSLARMRAGGMATNVLASGITNAAQGAAAAGLVSGGYSQPAGQQIGQGAALGGLFGVAGQGAQQLGTAARNALFGTASVAPEAASLAQQAVDQFGIPIRGSQITSNKFIRFLDSQLGRFPGGGMEASNEQIGRQFTRGVSNTIGADSDSLTHDVVNNAMAKVGAKFDQVAAQTGNIADAQLGNDLNSMLKLLPQTMTDSQAAPVRNNINQIFNLISENNGKLTGDTYQTLVQHNSPLDRLINNSDQTIGEWGEGIKEALNSALQRNAPQDVQDLLREARYQYKNYITLKPLIDKAQNGQISPAALQQRVINVWGTTDPSRAGDLATLSKIGQQFVKEPQSSGTSERASVLGILERLGIGAGAAIGIAEPTTGVTALAGLGGIVGTANLAGRALRSDWYRNMLINAATGGTAAAAAPGAVNQLLRASVVPAGVSARQGILSAPQISPGAFAPAQ